MYTNLRHPGGSYMAVRGFSSRGSGSGSRSAT
jgi:hypothetical protein